MMSRHAFDCSPCESFDEEEIRAAVNYTSLQNQTMLENTLTLYELEFPRCPYNFLHSNDSVLSVRVSIYPSDYPMSYLCSLVSSWQRKLQATIKRTSKVDGERAEKTIEFGRRSWRRVDECRMARPSLRQARHGTNVRSRMSIHVLSWEHNHGSKRLRHQQTSTNLNSGNQNHKHQSIYDWHPLFSHKT